MKSRKNKIFTLICLLSCIIVLLHIYYAHAGENADIQSLVKDNTTFACDLYTQLKGEEGNLFFSPYSISTALAMTYAGARGNTAIQMAEVLHFNLDQETLHAAFSTLSKHLQDLEKGGDIALKIANALWIQESLELLEEFLKLNKQYYESRLFRVNFETALAEARIKINEWVAEKTYEKIQELLQREDLDSLTRLVLTNAIYFKGNWQSPFDEKQTREESFWVTPSKAVMISMMYQKGSFLSTEDDVVQIVALPYVGENLAMLILLPFEMDGLPEVEKRLNAENIEAWLSKLQPQNLMIGLPKFMFSSRFDLKQTLRTMGMTEAFSGKAEFSGITLKGHLQIAKVIHEAFIEVNEKGTEATAATSVVLGRSMPRPFKVDHPFLFLIQDRSQGSILFVGRVVDPAE